MGMSLFCIICIENPTDTDTLDEMRARWTNRHNRESALSTRLFDRRYILTTCEL